VDLLVLDIRFRNRRDKIYRNMLYFLSNMWYIIFKFRKYLNCETLGMFKYMVQHIFLML
jgi:hypothetical protein